MWHRVRKNKLSPFRKASRHEAGSYMPSASQGGPEQRPVVPAALHLALMFFCSSFLFAHLQEYSASSLPVFEKVTADDSEDNKRVVLFLFFFFLSS